MSNSLLRFFKFGLIGVLGVAVNLGFYFLFHQILKLYDFPSKALAIELSILHNFAWNFGWTWGDRGTSRNLLWPRLLRYHGSTFVASFLITIGISYLIEIPMRGIDWQTLLSFVPVDISMPNSDINGLVAYLIGVGSGMIANFLLSDKWVFIPSKSKQQDSHA